MSDVYYDEFVDSFQLDHEKFQRLLRTYDDVWFFEDHERESLLKYFKEKVLNVKQITLEEMR